MDPPLSPPPTASTFRRLKIAIVGGGIGGLSAAIALRRTGHIVEIFERRSFDVEVSSFIACAANGTYWLREWEVDIPIMKPVILRKFVNREWETGLVLNQHNLNDYEATSGNQHYVFYRRDLHKGLLQTATSEKGEGIPCKLVVDHSWEHSSIMINSAGGVDFHTRCKTVDYETGSIIFGNGRTVTADLIVGADGIRSVVRTQIGITPTVRPASVTCHRCYVRTEEIRRLGFAEYLCEPAIQVWVGKYEKNGYNKYYRTVMALCSGGDIVSLYCFLPSELTDHHCDGFEFKEVSVDKILQGNYDKLDPDCANLIKHSVDRMPWRFNIHQPYEYWYKGRACILGDAAHPMLPYQAQGAGQAIEDAAALGILFSDKYDFTNNVEAGFAVYERVRKFRATKVQQASERAAEDMDERIGFTPLTPHEMALAAAKGKLTVNEINLYKLHEHIASEVGVEPASRNGHIPSRL